MNVIKYLLVVAILVLQQSTQVFGQCSGSPLVVSATTSKKYLSYPSSGNYNNNTDCTWQITRHYLYASTASYFLEITWSRFDIRGSMPSCATDYVEVFVGYPYRSIGKYCSSNIFGAMPFNMYSYNGYVKLVFHSDSAVNGAGFRISYEMRYVSTQNLGYPYSTTCRNTINAAQSGNIFSTKFPKVYSMYSLECKHTITRLKGNQMKIVFMHFDLENPGLYCTSLDDYVKIYGSEYSTISGNAVTSYLCGSKNPFYYTSNYKYTWLKFIRRNGGSTLFNDRGYVAGYLAYDEPAAKPPAKSKIGPIVGGIIGGLIIIAIIVAAVVWWMKMKSKGAVATTVVMHRPQEPQKRKSSKSSSSSSSSDSESDSSKKKKKKHKKHDPNGNPGYPAYPPPQQAGIPPPQAGYPPQPAAYPLPQYSQGTTGYPTYNMPNQPPVY